jgi:DHA1 family bicyclomycin/chloramphenicol resistance-like MFS transporter
VRTEVPPAEPVRPGGARFTALLGALTGFGPLSIDMYLPAMPALAASFGTTAGRVQLTLSAFFLGFGLGQLLYGPLADRWGRRPPLLAGISLYVAASGLCALAPRVDALIAARVVQGLGACAGPLIARAVVRDLYARERAARMLSLMLLVMGVAPLLAPLVGGQLLLAFGWRSIFALLAVFGLLCLAGAGLGLPETLPAERRAAVGVAAAVGRYVELLRHRGFLGYALCSASAYAGLFAYFAGSPFVFIELYSVPAERYGFLFALNVVGLLACAALNSRLVLLQGPDRLLGTGVRVIAVAGTVLLAAALTGVGGLAGLVGPIFCFVAVLSFIGANAMAGALAGFPHMAGTASALAGTIQFGFAALSGAAVGGLHDGTARPMALVMAAAGLGSLVVHRALVARRPAVRPLSPASGERKE